MEEKIPVANEMSTSQRPAIEVLQKLGYKYISEEENKNLRNNILTDVIFKDILAKKLNEINSYEYKERIYERGSDHHLATRTVPTCRHLYQDPSECVSSERKTVDNG